MKTLKKLFYRIDFRVSVLVAIALLSFHFIRGKTRHWVYAAFGEDSTDFYVIPDGYHLAPDYLSPPFLCGVEGCEVDHKAEALELLNAPEGHQCAIDCTFCATNDPDELEGRVTFWAETSALVLSILFALGIGFIVSRLVTRRLSLLSKWVERQTPDGPLQAMPVIKGNDEVVVLSHAIRNSYDRNLELVRELETRNEERAQWVAQVSHDLRTPLTALMVGLERGSMAVESNPQGKPFAKYFRNARLDSQRVLSLSEDLLATVRLEAGFPLAKSSLSPAALARSASEAVIVLFREGGIDLDLDVDADQFSIQGDLGLLQRSLTNLLDNAFRFAASQVRLEVRADLEARSVTFRVGDDGHGMGSEEKRSVGEAPHMGLGLQLVRKVAQMHDSELIQKRLEGWTWFSLTLPEEAGAPTAQRCPKQTS